MKANHYKHPFFLIILPIIFLSWQNALAVDNTIGISEANLKKIPIATSNLSLPDMDQDGLDDNLEKSIGSNYQSQDTDNDGYNDKLEIDNNYDPNKKQAKLPIDNNLSKKLNNFYLLRVERHGELWYVNNNKRYLTNNEQRKRLTLENLNQGQSTTSSPIATTSQNMFELAAKAIRANDKDLILSLSDDSYQKRVAYTMEHLNDEQKLTWANMLSSAKLVNETYYTKRYASETYFDSIDQKITNIHIVSRQADGTWRISQF